MQTRNISRKRKRAGFTLIEVIAVLVVLGILAAVALPRYIDLSNAARDRAVDAAIAELNGRESITWAEVMLGQDTVTSETLWAAMKNDDEDRTILSDGVSSTDSKWEWEEGPDSNGGRLSFDGVAIPLIRETLNPTSGPAVWRRGDWPPAEP